MGGAFTAGAQALGAFQCRSGDTVQQVHPLLRDTTHKAEAAFLRSLQHDGRLWEFLDGDDTRELGPRLTVHLDRQVILNLNGELEM